MTSTKKVVVSLAIFALVLLLAQLDVDATRWLSWFEAEVAENYLSAAATFFIVYFVVATLNLPGSGALTIAAGVVFDFVHGLILVSFASALGATLSMLIARTLLRPWAERRFAKFIDGVNKEIDKSGVSYLFSLRMIPLVPFFVVNPVFGLTNMRVWQFYLVSQLGLLPVTIISVYLGDNVGDLESVSFADVLTPEIIISFLLMMTFPYLAKWVYRKFYDAFFERRS